MLMLYDRLNDRAKCEGGKRDKHHILYPRRTYDAGFAKRLREFPWLRVEIPMCKHKVIHQEIERIPMPPAKRMKEALFTLERLASEGRLDRDATLEQRIDVLICIWGRYPECTPTCNALREQKRIIRKECNCLSR